MKFKFIFLLLFKNLDFFRFIKLNFLKSKFYFLEKTSPRYEKYSQNPTTLIAYYRNKPFKGRNFPLIFIFNTKFQYNYLPKYYILGTTSNQTDTLPYKGNPAYKNKIRIIRTKCRCNQCYRIQPAGAEI